MFEKSFENEALKTLSSSTKVVERSIRGLPEWLGMKKAKKTPSSEAAGYILAENWKAILNPGSRFILREKGERP